MSLWDRFPGTGDNTAHWGVFDLKISLASLFEIAKTELFYEFQQPMISENQILCILSKIGTFLLMILRLIISCWCEMLKMGIVTGLWKWVRNGIWLQLLTHQILQNFYWTNFKQILQLKRPISIFYQLSRLLEPKNLKLTLLMQIPNTSLNLSDLNLNQSLNNNLTYSS